MMAYSVKLSPPVPFPPDIDTAPIERISLAKLQAGDSTESCRMSDACSHLGCFLLDLQKVPDGEVLLDDADVLMKVAEEFFKLSLEEKQKYGVDSNNRVDLG